MDSTRAVLYGVLFLLGFMIWTTYQQEQLAKQPAPAVVSAPSMVEAATPASSVSPSAHDVPTTIRTTQTAAVAPALSVTKEVPAERVVTLQNDVVRLSIDLLGGKVLSADLLNYKEKLGEEAPVEMFNQKQNTLYDAQTGVLDLNAPSSPLPQFTVDGNRFELGDGQSEITVPMKATLPTGVVIHKTLRLARDRYLLEETVRIENHSDEQFRGRYYGQIGRKEVPVESSFFIMSAYQGAAISDPNSKKYETISYSDMRKTPLSREVTGGWIAQQEHYFTSALIPPKHEKRLFYSHTSQDGRYLIGMTSLDIALNPGQTYQSSANLYVGPAITERLEAAAPDLDKTVDYGILWFISVLLLWALKQVNLVVHNWGWSIVIVTLFIKIIFYKLAQTQYRSMANLRLIQPKIEALKERYGDDRQRLSQGMMELYKKEKINPLGGCLPILVQIPVFIALYWVLLESVELRHAPFVGWIHDLSVADPFYVLPLLMGGSMYLMQKMTPASPDPMMAKMTMVLPIVFTALFLNFPAGLVLYWFVNNALSILQQWHITRGFEKAAAAKSQ